jgi:hypothetical protein
MSYLTKLRQKPKHVRDNIAFVAAGVATLPVMAYLVFAVHGPKLSDDVVESNVTDRKFFETFTNQIKDQVASVKEAATNTATSSQALPAVIDRGPLDAVPVVAPATSSERAITIATTTSEVTTDVTTSGR